MRHERAPRILALAAVATVLATPARAQFRAGPQFRVNSYTTLSQFGPRVAAELEGERAAS